jgi:hypothetical protein
MSLSQAWWNELEAHFDAFTGSDTVTEAKSDCHLIGEYTKAKTGEAVETITGEPLNTEPADVIRAEVDVRFP